MARHRGLLFVVSLMVMLAATPAFAGGKFSSGFRGGHGFHQEFHRQQPHGGRHFSFGVPHQHRFDRHFGFERNPKSFHTQFKHHHFSPHIGRH
jgi:hypothetical protein